MSTPYYSDEHVTLYHGDCREFLPLLNDIDAIVTDPPYGLGDVLHSPGSGSGRREWAKFWAQGAPAWDTEAPSIVSELPAMTDFTIIWGGNHFPLPPSRGWLIWDKIVRQFTSGHAELAWTSLDQPIRTFNFAHGQLANEGKLHPTQKPLTLMAWCIRFLPESCAVIVDPFAGSGTTLRAAKDEGRRAVGIEIDERYCEVAARRLAQGVLDITGEVSA